MQTLLSKTVKIGPNFFSGAFRDYSNWHWAWVREILQNSIDSSGCNKIEVSISQDMLNDTTVVEVSNNGEPMTHDILVNKFLSLGESGKNFQNSVGGFGKAKELIVFCHKSWQIRTGNMLAYGEGGSYEIEDNHYHLHGTTTKVVMTGNQTEELKAKLKVYASYTDWHGTLSLDGQILNTSLKAETHRKDLSFGKIYTNKTDNINLQNLVICRINGIPMFKTYCSELQDTVIIELDGSSALTSNRDGLTWQARSEFDKFIEDISMNRQEAFKDSKKADKTRFSGYKLHGKLDIQANLYENVKITDHAALEDLKIINPATIQKLSEVKTVYDQPLFRPEFFLRSEVDKPMPLKSMPGTMSGACIKLINDWSNILVEIATLLKIDKQFAIGFVFSEESAAMHEYDYNSGHIIYINPLDNEFKHKWSKENFWELVSTALHELIHLEGYSRHDEKYASRLTDAFSVVLANKSKIQACIKDTGKWVDK